MSSGSQEGGGYVGKVRDEMQAYIRTLLEANDKLRDAVAVLESGNAGLTQELRAAHEEAAARQKHEEELHGKLQEIRSESESFRSQFAELETQSANLANLYVASYQLNGTLDRDAILGAIQEIIINLVGSEEFGVFECDANEAGLRMISSFAGLSAEVVQSYAGVARVFESGEPWIAGESVDAAEPLACIPLKLDGRITGLIVIHRLLGHKPALDPLDHELFALLGRHAATALYCTALHEREAVS
jgi:hypothetical protein